MQAIVTKFISATNHKPMRMSASCATGHIIVEWDDALEPEGNHIKAAMDLCAKLEWPYAFASGSLPDGRMAHVFLPKVLA
jgi:hypothetical protein